MAKIAFILLCHKNPEAIIQQARQLTAVGDYMSIHFDARSSAEDYQQIKTALEGSSAKQPHGQANNTDRADAPTAFLGEDAKHTLGLPCRRLAAVCTTTQSWK